MRKKEAKVKAAMELAKAITYLDDLVASLKAGKIAVGDGETSLSLAPEEAVKVEVKATQKVDKESISIELSWRKPEPLTEDPGLQIRSDEPAPRKGKG